MMVSLRAAQERSELTNYGVPCISFQSKLLCGRGMWNSQILVNLLVTIIIWYVGRNARTLEHTTYSFATWVQATISQKAQAWCII